MRAELPAPTALSRILDYKADEVAALKSLPAGALLAAARAASPTRRFQAALNDAVTRGNLGVIAEIKKASPSKGLIRADFDPAALARSYEAGGVSCLSVLTDSPSFQGSPDALRAARAACSLPVLRKDFMIDPLQVVEARAMGADAILVIMAAVDDATASALIAAAGDWGMDVLVEVHDAKEMARANALDVPLIGVNNRDLRTFVTDLGLTERLAPLVRPGALLIAESGVATREDVARLASAGARAFLIGETFMRAADPGRAAADLFA